MASLAEVLQRGWELHQSGNVKAAMQLYRGVLDQAPKSADAWVYLGIAQFDQRAFADSVRSYRHAISLRANFPIAWNNLGNSLRMLGEVEGADECFATALAQQPGYLSAIKNRGTLWVWSGDIERGLRWYEDGLQLNPSEPELHRNLGVIRLLMGDFARGWDEYRWRWRMAGISRAGLSMQLAREAIHVPLWTGAADQPIADRTFLMYPEQGLGDAIQFVRVANRLHREGARVIVTCESSLVPLLGTAPGIDQVLPDLAGMFDADYLQSLRIDYQGSFIEILDGLFQRDGELDTHCGMTWSPGYLSVPEPSRAYWGRWLDATLGRGLDGTRRIGINWQGNPEHHADVYRSVPLAEFAPLVAIPGVELVSVQFGHGVEQLSQVPFGDSIHRLPMSVDQTSGKFLDTASVLANLDAVVTSDTAVAHLAGAVGIPVHLILGRVPDWRWLTAGDTTQWYPTARLYRQASLGEWSPCLRSVVEELTEDLP